MSEKTESPRRGRRIALGVLVSIVVVALAAWIALSLWAADFLVGAVRHAAEQAGLQVDFDGSPTLSMSGFDATNVRLRTVEGNDLLRAVAVHGSARFFLHQPFVAVSLDFEGARLVWTGRDASVGVALNVPTLSSIVTRLRFDDARIDLGEGRELRVDGELTGEADGGLRLLASRVDYSEPSGERAAERLAGSARLSVVEPDPEATEELGGVRLVVAISSGAALLGPVLLDFAASPARIAGVVMPTTTGAYRGSDLAFSLGKLLRVTGRVELGGEGSVHSADFTALSEDLAPAFVTLVRDPFGASIPALTEASVEGRGQLMVHLRSPSRRSLDATISLSLSRLRTRSVEADAVDVVFPWIAAGMTGRVSREGHVRAARLGMLGLPWTGVDVSLSAAPGRLRANGVQQWKSTGGTLRIEALSLEDDKDAGPRLGANVRLDGFDLAQLGEAAGRAGLSGTLEGDLGRVTIDSGAIRVPGSVNVGTFGGTLTLSKLSVDSPFARVPLIGLDATLSNLDLGAITAMLGVGRVSGVLEGRVSNLILAAGEPQSFDADLHSVSRSGVPQTVDVRAIVQLGVLGGGDRGSITGSLLKVIDRYRYAALGLRCRLRNDVFELRGVESDGDKEYLVKGSLLPPSVSVVSHSQVVSFSEMLRRIQTIASVGEGGSSDAKPN